MQVPRLFLHCVRFFPVFASFLFVHSAPLPGLKLNVRSGVIVDIDIVSNAHKHIIHMKAHAHTVVLP